MILQDVPTIVVSIFRAFVKIYNQKTFVKFMYNNQSTHTENFPNELLMLIKKMYPWWITVTRDITLT